jgi:hypothetical protein
MSKKIALLLVLVLTISGITPFFSQVSAESLSYGGTLPVDDVPALEFSMANGSILNNLDNIGFLTSIGFPNKQTLMAALYSVSYKASWQDNPVIVYQWSIHDPANRNDDDPNPKGSLFYAIDLTNVPQGVQQIEVTVIAGGELFGGKAFYTVSTNITSSLSFTVIVSPSPTANNATASALAWKTQSLDANGAAAYVANGPIVALDSNNIPHIAYSKLLNYTISDTRFVMYASWNGVGWNTQAVAAGVPFSLVLDGNDVPHVLYGGGLDWGGIGYAKLSGSNWITQTIDRNADAGTLAFDSSGNPHIVYTDGKVLKYASWSGSNWNFQTIDTIDAVYANAFQTSLAFDQKDTPYILYGYPTTSKDISGGADYPTEILKLATKKSSNWNIQTMPLSPAINGYGNLALDSKGYPHFVCSENQNRKEYPAVSAVLYVSWDGSAWNTQNVVSNVSLGIYSPNTNWGNMGFLALDSHDYPHISYITHAPETEFGGNNSLM